MVIDSSALVAVLRNEPEAEAVCRAIAADPVRLISSVSVLEATCVLVSRKGDAAVAHLQAFLAEFEIEEVEFNSAQRAAAQRAWLVFGKGRHPAGLNFGDCASYALARVRREPLLFSGADFGRTEVVAAGRRPLT